MARLRADALRQSICHRAVIEGADQPALTVHPEVSSSPDRRGAYIRDENRIISGDRQSSPQGAGGAAVLRPW